MYTKTPEKNLTRTRCWARCHTWRNPL